MRIRYGSAAALAITATVAFAQAPKPGPGSGTNPNPTTSTPTSTPGTIFSGSSPNGSTASKTPTELPRTIYVTGKVAFQDGREPGQAVLIERICTGRPHPEGYTDAKGSFSLRLGQEMDVVADASEAQNRNTSTAQNPGGGIKESQLMACDLRAVLSGYRSDTVQLAGRKYMDNPDIGTIVLRPLVATEGLTISATSALAPKDAHKAFDRGVEATRKMKLDEAENEFHRAVEIYPRYAAAWFELGHVLERLSRSDEARYSYSQSIAADSHYLNPYERLYLMAFHDKKWQECAASSDRVMHLDPYNYPASFYYNAVANLQLKHFDVAEKAARQAVVFDTQHVNPQGLYVLGVILIQRQDYNGAVDNFHAYLRIAPDGNEAPQVRKALRDVETYLAAKNTAAKAAPVAPPIDQDK